MKRMIFKISERHFRQKVENDELNSLRGLLETDSSKLLKRRFKKFIVTLGYFINHK